MEVGVTVGEDAKGNLFYNLNRDPAELQKKKLQRSDRGKALGPLEQREVVPETASEVNLTIAWSASLRVLDGAAFDASRPNSFWSARNRLWLLSGDLPWIRYKGQTRTPVDIVAELGGRSIFRTSVLPGDVDVPIYILVGEPVRSHARGPILITSYGEVPKGARYDQLRGVLAATLARWRRDIVPDDVDTRSRFNYAWFGEAPAIQPGLFASTGSDAILMQFVPDPRSPDPFAKLEAGVLLTGAHEGFHALSGSLSEGKPAWVNESWASYFAYAAARRSLTGRPLAMAKELFEESAEQSVLHAQRLLDQGDGSGYGVFYTRAARFWAAIDDTLTVRPNGTGRLAALIKRTHGMAGVNWRDPDSISTFLDRYSEGRASAIVQCYLVEDRCSRAEGRARF